MRQTILVVVAALTLLAIAIFVWPTQWQYTSVGPNNALVRVNRFSGEVFILGESGWERLSKFSHLRIQTDP